MFVRGEYRMSTEEQNAVIGKLVQERSELRREYSALVESLKAGGQNLVALGEQLLSSPESVSLDSGTFAQETAQLPEKLERLKRVGSQLADKDAALKKFDIN
jgi:hypothetical protein